MRIVTIGLALALSPAASAAISPGGWDHLGDGGTPNTASLDGRVDALSAAPDSLYAGGVFTKAGGDTAAAYIARWDGSAWHSVGAPALNGDVDAIAVDGAKIYVGGHFTNAGGDASADFVAVWNGAVWTHFCNPITATVNALRIVGRTLYIGGDFANGAGLASADKLVACNLDTGAPSSTVDSDGDINGSVLALTADSAGNLYAGGAFSNMDQIASADHVAMFDGAWHAMGASAVTDFVRSLASDGTNVYIGTDAVNVGGIAQADHVARWDGSAWSALGAGTADPANGWFSTSTFIDAIAVSAGKVYAAGSFQNADGNATADEIAMFDGTAWAPMGSDGAGNGPLGGTGLALAPFGGQIVVGGNFNVAGGDGNAGYIARYPGLGPAPMPVGGSGTLTLIPGLARPASRPTKTPASKVASSRLVVKHGSRTAKLLFDCTAAQKCAVKGTLKVAGRVIGTVMGTVGAQHAGTVVVTFTGAGRQFAASKKPTTVTVAVTSTSAGNVTHLPPGKVVTISQLGRPPTATTGAASSMIVSNLTTARATLAGFVGPHGHSTRYHFEIGDTPAYGQSIPAAGAVAGDDFAQHLVTARATGLQDGHLYHYRLVAESIGGTTVGADRRFTLPLAPVDNGPQGPTVFPPLAQTNNTYTCADDAHGLLSTGSHLVCTLKVRYDNPFYDGSLFGPDPVTISLIALAPAGTLTASGTDSQRINIVMVWGQEVPVTLSFEVRHPAFATEALVVQPNGPATVGAIPAVAQPALTTTSNCTGRHHVGDVLTCEFRTINAGLDAANFSTFTLHPSRGLIALGASSGTPPDVLAAFSSPSTYTERFQIARGTTSDAALSIALAYSGVNETDQSPFSHTQTFAAGHVTTR